MTDRAKGPNRLDEWLLRLTMVVYAGSLPPLYVWFLHHSTVLWVDQLREDTFLRFWLPIVVPGAAVSFTLLAAVSWWYTLFSGRQFLMGRNRRWFLVVFIAALSMAAGVITAPVRNAGAAAGLTALVTSIGMFGLWLLPPIVSPRLLEGLSGRGRRFPDG